MRGVRDCARPATKSRSSSAVLILSSSPVFDSHFNSSRTRQEAAACAVVYASRVSGETFPKPSASPPGRCTMFTDEAVESVGAESLWRSSQAAELRSKSCQTAALDVVEAETQVLHWSEYGTQTDLDDQGAQDIDLVDDNQTEYPGLADFLDRVKDMVISELAKNARSHAFDGFEVNWEEQTQTVSCTHSLQYPEAQERNLHVTSISWNSTGSVIACAFGRMDDGDWSTEKSFVCTWNLHRQGLNPKRPDTVIDVGTAVMSISFHPSRPSLIAGGLYTGEVVVWDTNQIQDPVLAKTGMSPDTHRDPVCQVCWVPSGRRGEFAVLSAGCGGRVLLWTIREQSALVLSAGYALIRHQLPMLTKAGGGSTMGIASLALSPWDLDTFLVGSEGGLVIRCAFSAQATATVNPDGESMTLRAPAKFCFSPHCGPVYTLHYSPFHRNLFLSAGTDGFTHLHSLLQVDPVVSLQVSDSYVFGVRWSPTRPLLFAAATGEGSVQMFDLSVMSLRPVTTIEQNNGGRPVYCLEFNPRQTHLLATGNANGTVNIWHLSSELTEQGPKEVAQLEHLATEVAE
ncbi:WD repeat-containing protein 34 [Arapaima gigas]